MELSELLTKIQAACHRRAVSGKVAGLTFGQIMTLTNKRADMRPSEKALEHALRAMVRSGVLRVSVGVYHPEQTAEQSEEMVARYGTELRTKRRPEYTDTRQVTMFEGEPSEQ